MKRSMLYYVMTAMMICLMLLAGCTKDAPSVSTGNTSNSTVSTDIPVTQPEETSDEFTKITYRTIHTMGTMYNVLMGTAGSLHKEKVITDEQKKKMIDLGYIYYGSYQGLVTAFESYQKVKSEDGKISLTLMLIQTVKQYNTILEYYNDVTKGVKGVQQWTKI